MCDEWNWSWVWYILSGHICIHVLPIPSLWTLLHSYLGSFLCAVSKNEVWGYILCFCALNTSPILWTLNSAPLQLQAEVDRLNELKKQNMAKFVQATRAELHKIWDLCFYGSEQRREFAPAFCGKERVHIHCIYPCSLFVTILPSSTLTPCYLITSSV